MAASPAIEQHAMARLIEMGAFDRHLRRARKVYLGRRAALLSALEQRLGDGTVSGAAAELHVWLQPPGEVDAAAYGQPAPLTGLVLGYAQLAATHSTEAVGRLADAVREVDAGICSS